VKATTYDENVTDSNPDHPTTCQAHTHTQAGKENTRVFGAAPVRKKRRERR